jgi:3-methyladenine DNA glycosylase Tag
MAEIPQRLRGAFLKAAYARARHEVQLAGFGLEAVWQAARRLDDLAAHELLMEHAWVVLSAGMSEAVVRRRFPDIARCFEHWRSPATIADNPGSYREAATAVFAHHRKIDAILRAAQAVAADDFGALRRRLQEDPLATLRQFGYIGPVTVYHLAKNLGVNVAKPDRHLCRLAVASGCKCAHDLCAEISGLVGDPVSIVDLVLWRFATVCPSYPSVFDWNPA